MYPMFRCLAHAVLLFISIPVLGQQNMVLWETLAPEETTRSTGETLPFLPNENPHVTRVVKIRAPSLDIYLPTAKPTGTGVLIIPGGGFGKVVVDKEGSEAATWLNSLGIAAFVLRHRTNEENTPDEPVWRRPLQDAQRAIRLIRQHSNQWQLNPDRIGVLGFSAGGQVAAILLTAPEPDPDAAGSGNGPERTLPDFALLIYPWRTLKPDGRDLIDPIRITPKTAPAFLVHTHDDGSSSVGSALIYIALKQNNVSAELHIYQNGGHGYGMRKTPGSDTDTWPNRATDWLRRRGLGR
jgi:acetyl esterase/lipase